MKQTAQAIIFFHKLLFYYSLAPIHMIKKILLPSIMLFIGTLAQGQVLISMSPNHGNVTQTLTTTVTSSGFYYTWGSAPTIFDTYLQQNGSGAVIYPNWINVLDDDHFDAEWTINSGMPVGLYDLVYYQGPPPWGWPTTLPNAFTITDTCNIARDPINGAVCQGDSVKLTFSSAASSYQWKLNGVNIPGATQQNYYAKTAGSYSLTATGSGCSIPINSATVTIYSLPPAIINPSATQHLCPGQAASLLASTGPGYTYKWKKNGVDIPGMTQYSLSVKDSGNYKVQVTDGHGCSSLSASTKITNTTMPTAVLTRQPGASGGKDAVIDSYGPNGNNGNSLELNALAWTISSNPVIGRALFQFDLSPIPPGSQIYSAELNLYFDSTSSNANHIHYGSNAAYIQRITSSWSESTVTWNNQPSTTTTNQLYLPTSTSPYQDYLRLDVKNLVRTMIDTPSANYGFLLKLLTETQYRSLLFVSSDDANSSRRPKLVVKYNSTTVSSSNGLTICNGDSTKLQASVGSGSYTYQWRKNGAIISGATATSFVAKNTGTYTFQVTNNYGCSATSIGQVVTVNPLPTATATASGPTTFCAGDSVVLAGNSGTNLTYQWKKNNNTINGATNRKYTAKTAGSYKVKVTNVYGCSKLSSAVTVTVPCRESDMADGASLFAVDAYPNPSQGDFHLKLINASDEGIHVRVFDVTGRLVNQMLFTASDEIIISGIAVPGIYKAQVIQGNNIRFVTLIRSE